jgi:hypothetical protein
MITSPALNLNFSLTMDSTELKNMLQGSNEDFKSIKILEISKGPTDGWVSTAMIATVQINDNQIKKLFIKTSLPETDPYHVYSYEYNMDVCEDEAYRVILPKLVQFEKRSLGYSIIQDFLPKYYTSQLTAAQNTRVLHLILEDLSAEGFTMKKNLPGLGLNQVKLVLTKIAHFHAVSYAYSKTYSHNFRKVDYIDFKKFMKNPKLFELVGNTLPVFIQDVEANKADPEVIAALKKLSENYGKTFENAFGYLTNENFLGHGDLWSNNIMFKDSVKEVKLIDWQGMNGLDPLFDFCRFVYANVDPLFIEEWLDELQRTYYGQLETSLNLFELPVPFSLDDFFSKCNNGAFAIMCAYMFFYDPVGRETVMNKRLIWMASRALKHCPHLYDV